MITSYVDDIVKFVEHRSLIKTVQYDQNKMLKDKDLGIAAPFSGI